MSKNTKAPIQKFISSTWKENSEMRKQIINLGRLLVKELKIEPGVDTISRWMAHYIADQIKICESAVGAKKKEAEKKCFSTILELWRHRAYYPRGNKPFENFEPIFKTLEKLNPDLSKNSFYRIPSIEGSESGKNNVQKGVLDLLKVAEKIDYVARIWLDYIFHEAALLATDEKTAALIKNTISLNDNVESKLIVRILTGENDINKEDKKRKILTEHIKQLKDFENFNRSLYKIFEKKLELLTKEQKSLKKK